MATFSIDPDKMLRRLSRHLARGSVDYAVGELETALKSLPETPSHEVLKLKFINSPEEVAGIIDDFIVRESCQFEVKALYTETNGYAHNTDQWWFSLFGYQRYAGHADYDWLSAWDSTEQDGDLVVLSGMEPLQKIFEDWGQNYETYQDSPSGPNLDMAEKYCSLLVICRFQSLIRDAVRFTTRMKCPILVTSHEYDFIAEFGPPCHE